MESSVIEIEPIFPNQVDKGRTGHSAPNADTVNHIVVEARHEVIPGYCGLMARMEYFSMTCLDDNGRRHF